MSDRSYFFAVNDKNSKLETTIESVKHTITDFHISIFEYYEFENSDKSVFVNSEYALETINTYFNKNKNKFEKSTIIKLLKHYNSFKNFKYFGFNAVEILQDKYDVFLKDLKNGKIGNKYEITNYIDWYGLYYDKFK